MNRLIKRTKTPIAIVAILIISITYLTFFLPMKRELQNSYLRNFRLLSESKVYSIYTFIENGLDCAENLSNKTVKKSKILEYKNGEIGFDEVKQAITSININKVDSNNDLTGVVSIVGNVIISEYGVCNYGEMDKLVKSPFFDYNILVRDDNVHLIVYSPIIDQNQVIGYDITYYNRPQLIRDLMSDEISVEIIYEKEANELMKNGKKSKVDDGKMLIDFDDSIGYISKLDKTDKYIYTYTLKDKLYEPIKRIAIISQSSIALGLLILFIAINHIVLRNANEILNAVENSRDKFKEHAYKDPLTGVCSRLFLNTWIENNLDALEEQNVIYSIAMIDGDNFKEINDNYGHSVGDKVLARIADILQKSVRQNDIVIRYGGDEFLIIFENIVSDTAENILKRVEKKLVEIDDFEFDITISYGISEIRNSEDFFQSLNKADEKMYSSKQKKV